MIAMRAIMFAFGWLLSGSVAWSAAFSGKTNDIYLAVSSVSESWPVTNALAKADERLVWAPYTDNGEVRLRYSLDPAYLARFRLVDERGREVRKTALGKAYGSRWDALKSYKTTRFDGVVAWGSFEHTKGQGGGRYLPAPEELFHIQREGRYTLVIEMQMFRHTARTNVNDWSKNLLRFSPIKLNVIK